MEQPTFRKPPETPAEPAEPTLEELLNPPAQEQEFDFSDAQASLNQEPVYYGSSTPEEPVSRFSTLLDFLSQNRKMLLICSCAVLLVALLGTIVGILFVNSADPYDKRILNNVSAAGINLGGMTKAEAIRALKDEIGDLYDTNDMLVKIEDTTLTFDSSEVDITVDYEALVEDAYRYGRTGTKDERDAAYQSSLTSVHIIGLLPYLELEEDYIREILNEYASGFTTIYSEASYRLEGDMPPLGTDKF